MAHLLLGQDHLHWYHSFKTPWISQSNGRYPSDQTDIWAHPSSGRGWDPTVSVHECGPHIHPSISPSLSFSLGSWRQKCSLETSRPLKNLKSVSSSSLCFSFSPFRLKKREGGLSYRFMNFEFGFRRAIENLPLLLNSALNLPFHFMWTMNSRFSARNFIEIWRL